MIPARSETPPRPAASVTSRYIVSLGGRVVGAVAQTAFVALIARSLSTPEFAVYGVLFSVCQVVIVVMELGFATRILRLAVDPDSRGVVGALIVSRVIVAAALTVIGIIFLQSHPDRAGIVWAVVVYVCGDSLGDFGVGILQGERRSVAATGLLIVRRLIALVPFLLGLTVTATMLGLLSSGFLGMVVFLVVAVRRAGRPTSIKALVRYNGPLSLLGIATGLTQGDTAIVSTVSSAGLTASYAAASRLGNPINLAVSTLLQVVVPEFAGLTGMDRYRAFVKARAVVSVIAVIIALSSFLSPLVVLVLYGPAFAGAAPILAGVLIGAAISAFTQIHLAWLVVDGLSIRVPIGVAAAVLIGMSVLLVAVSTLGAAGAAVGIGTTQTLIAAVVVAEWRRSTRTLRAR